MNTRRGVLRSAVGILDQAGRGLLFAVTAVTVLEASVALSVLWAIKSLIDVLTEEGINARTGLLLSLMVFLIAFSGMLTICANYLRTRQEIRVGEVVDRRVHEMAIDVDYPFYESAEYFDSLERAKQGGSQRPAQVLGNCLVLLRSSIFLFGAAALLATINLLILPVLFASVLFILAVRINFTKLHFMWQRSRAQCERRAGYIDSLITSNYHAPELRLADIGPTLMVDYQNARQVINHGQLLIERRKALAESFVTVLGAIAFALSAWLIFDNSSSNGETVANLVLFILVFRRAELSGRELVQGFARLYSDRLYLEQLFKFLDMDSCKAAGGKKQRWSTASKSGLQVENLSFSYPGIPKPALDHINLEIPRGSIVALVGENGAGKTTLIKLLTRLYEPAEGRILLDGIDVKELDAAAYRKKFSVVFQSFTCYSDTLRRNIAAGDMSNSGDDRRLLEALKRAGSIDLLSQLPKGLDTMLSRVFEGGEEVSIGQWQRIALARAFFRQSDFLILDEPSSALDARAESDLFENLRERADGRGVLLISHRLSTVRSADYTYVMDGGRIIEQGTHDVLSRMGGRYSELFELQSRQYK